MIKNLLLIIFVMFSQANALDLASRYARPDAFEAWLSQTPPQEVIIEILNVSSSNPLELIARADWLNRYLDREGPIVTSLYLQVIEEQIEIGANVADLSRLVGLMPELYNQIGVVWQIQFWKLEKELHELPEAETMTNESQMLVDELALLINVVSHYYHFIGGFGDRVEAVLNRPECQSSRACIKAIYSARTRPDSNGDPIRLNQIALNNMLNVRFQSLERQMHEEPSLGFSLEYLIAK